MLDPAELTVVVGPNGSGKSSLLSVLLGQLRPSAGSCSVDGRPAHAWSPRERAARLAWLPQEHLLESGVTVREVVASSRFRHAESWREGLEAADAVLGSHGLLPFAGATMDTLSGGEAQRTRLATLEAQEAAWWLLDEPGNHLDASVQLQLLDTLRARVDAGGGTLLVTHALELLPHLLGTPTRVLGLRAGRLEVDAPLSDPDLPERLGALVGLDLRAVSIEGTVRWTTLGRRT